MVKKIPYNWLSVLFLLLSGVPLYFLNTLSKGNFLAGPVSIIICIPLIIVQAVIVFAIWKSRINYNRNLVLITVSFLIICFEILLLYKYVTEIT